jgi:hypothetical protein
MIERRQGADAHEFGGADLDEGNPKIVVEVRNYRVGHVVGLLAAKERTITARHCDFHRRE